MKSDTHIHADLAGGAPLTPKAAKRAARRQRKAERAGKKAKRAPLSRHRRPIICPPDKAGRGPLFRTLGLLCRSLVVWLSAAGLTAFISDALELGVSHGSILLSTLMTVAICTVFSLGGIWRLIAGVLASGGAVGLIALEPSLPQNLLYGLLSVYNGALERLYRVGYLTYVQYKVSFQSTMEAGELLTLGMALIGMAAALLFAACMLRRVRILPPAVLSTSVIVVILTFNIYSNRVESNLGIVLVVVSFAAVLVMAAYDRLYRPRGKALSATGEQYDTEIALFEDGDRPVLPREVLEARAARTDKRAKRIARRERERDGAITVDEEITDYFSKSKKSKPIKKKATAEDKAARKAIRRRIREVRAYDRVSEQARTAMGGYAAGAVLLVCLIAIGLPALLVRGNFSTIDAIDEKVALARDYVTALLRGDDEQLDRLEFGADKDNFKPRPTTLEQLQYENKQLFYVQSRYNTNYYLRGWIGTDYRDGAWLAVDDETLAAYQALFGKDGNPAEDMRYNFYHYMAPELVDDPNYTENLLSKYNANPEYGFVALLVHTRRVNSAGTMTYFPTVFDPNYGVMNFGTTEKSPLSFVNYYDGMYTGRKFHKNGVSYATMTYAPIMKNDTWIQNQAALEAAYNLQREAILVRTGVAKSADGGATSYLTLITEAQKNGMTMFTYTYNRKGEGERIWRFYHATEDITINEKKDMVITTDTHVLTLNMSGSRVMGAEVRAIAGAGESLYRPITADLVGQYDKHLTDDGRAELLSHIRTEQDYADFVYKTYLGTAGSDFLRELAATIRAEAHVEVEKTVTEEVPDDPETPEEDGYTYDRVVREDVPADVSLAAVRNASDPEVYIQRDRLVRNIIDYIITEMGCTYTITPDLSNVDAGLDGVENFLRNTKEGYCVQFASAVALLLRELGVPARYVEGYVASDFSRVPGQQFEYYDYVMDYEAHAWVEVYFDGVGWVQYEATPQYYAGLYGSEGSIGGVTPPPVMEEEETQRPIAPTETLPEDEETDPAETETGEGDDTAALTRGTLIGLLILVALAAVAIALSTVASRARAAEDHRESVAAQILEPGFGEHTSDSDRREMALEMGDAVTALLGYYGLSPMPGEFREDYVARLRAELTPEKPERARGDEAMEMPDLCEAFAGMAAEEFGHGMSTAEMKAVAALYLYLRRDLRRRIALPDRLVLRYVKRKI